MFLPHHRVKVSIVGSLRDREVACSASDRQGSNFESCVWRTVSSQSAHYPQEVLLAQFSLYVHKGGLKPDSFHFFGAVIINKTCLYVFKQYRNYPHCNYPYYQWSVFLRFFSIRNENCVLVLLCVKCTFLSVNINYFIFLPSWSCVLLCTESHKLLMFVKYFISEPVGWCANENDQKRL